MRSEVKGWLALLGGAGVLVLAIVSGAGAENPAIGPSITPVASSSPAPPPPAAGIGGAGSGG
ncbi:hypothetical protein [Mycobacterium parmense]|uniref:Uncharacterized protein n=1 Tax=Mycobacterium parmense TaxID=185642 RepID=A0A7I7YYI3_9MYCO|nr:hypothetical protein [Mycobacterium parmense]MCV7352721.1 hypothetical protein [Mycobacterium parmense]BBZ46729.1 hypothetical protein MPRM_40100 [Mycobacterium parmense]